MRTLAIAAAAAIAFTSVPAHAAVVLAGTTGNAIDPFDASTRGTLLASSSTSATGLSFAATFNTAVYRNTLGTLDFYYQIVRTGAGSGPPPYGDTGIQYLDGSPYDSLGVFAYVDNSDFDGAGLFLALNNPNGSGGTAFRSADGNTVGIDLSPIILFGTYNTGTYIFRTNAVDFTAGTFGARSRTLLQTAAFAPVAVPEPGSWMMLLMGFAGLGFVLRARRRAVGRSRERLAVEG